MYLDFEARFQAAAGVVDCYVYLWAPSSPLPEVLPVPGHHAVAAQERCALVAEPYGDS